MAEASIPAAAGRRTAACRCRDVDGDRHRHAVWRGRDALLILQQCAPDVRVGAESIIWLHPWPGAELLTAFMAPLIDRLTRSEHSGAA